MRTLLSLRSTSVMESLLERDMIDVLVVCQCNLLQVGNNNSMLTFVMYVN